MGALVCRHEIIDAMGVYQVYAATWCQTDVAVKCIITKGSPAEKEFFDEVKPMSAEELEFLREIKLMSECSHRNIVTFYSASMQPGKVRLQNGSIRAGYSLIERDINGEIEPKGKEELKCLRGHKTVSESHLDDTITFCSASMQPCNVRQLQRVG